MIAWHVLFTEELDPQEASLTDIPETHDGAMVLNASNQPVFNVEVRLVGETSNRAIIIDSRSVLPTTPEALVASNGQVPSPRTEEKLRATITFRDMAGRWWRRFETGELQRTDQHGMPKDDTQD